MSVVVAERPVEGVMLLRLNRPEVRNALSLELRRALVDRLEAAAEDQGVRAAVVTGNEKAFAAGADIRSRGRGGPSCGRGGPAPAPSRGR